MASFDRHARASYLHLTRPATDPQIAQIEPTESEGLRDIDQFCDAMIKIRQEADEIIAGKQPLGNNIITNAPHTMQVVTTAEWDRCDFAFVSRLPLLTLYLQALLA